MTNDDILKPEYKTMRVSAPTYYKVVELAGLWSALAGYNFSITETVDAIVAQHHQLNYQSLIATLQNPKISQQLREQAQQQITNLAEMMKNVKIRK